MTHQMETAPVLDTPDAVGKLTKTQADYKGTHARVQDAETMTILTEVEGRRLTKLWPADGGKPLPRESGATYFSVQERGVACLEDVERVLLELEPKRSSFIVRGEYVGPDADRGRTRRNNQVLADVPRHVLMIDVDGFKPSAGDPVSAPALAIEEFAREHLPECFHGRSFVWQLSSSAGHPTAAGVLKAHVWYRLETPYTAAQLRAWHKAHKRPNGPDASVFKQAQELYTAGPAMGPGQVDPVARRVGLEHGGRGDVVNFEIDAGSLAAVARLGKPPRLEDAVYDPVYEELERKEEVLGYDETGTKAYVRCPLAHLHTDPGDIRKCCWQRAGTGGYALGHVHCFSGNHGDHGELTDADFLQYHGISTAATADDFEDHGAAADESEPPSNNVHGFLAFLPRHEYIDMKTGTQWPAVSINAALVWPIDRVKKKPKKPTEGEGPATPESEYEDAPVPPARWLDQNRPVHQLGWLPGRPRIVRDTVMMEGGSTSAKGRHVFNLYRPPAVLPGDAALAGPWLDHVQRVYPDAEHLFNWFACQVQDVAGKVNHCLVLGGAPGVGKDSLLVPVRGALGGWNCSDISPSVMLGRFNGWLRAKLVVVSEARDLGEANRFQFYEASKVYMAAPPDMLRVDEKNRPEYYVQNVLGMVITTNNRGDALYLPADDRRHYVAWSEARKEDFSETYWRELYAWYEAGGIGHVAAWLRARDLSGFNPKAAPPLTKDFWHIVSSGEAPENAEYRDLIEAVPMPEAFTLADLATAAAALDQYDVSQSLREHKQRPAIKHKLLRLGFGAIRNPDVKEGYWKVEGQRVVIYAPLALPFREQVRLCRLRQQLADFC